MGAVTDGFEITIPIDTVVRDDQGSTTLLATEQVPPEYEGQLCTVQAQSENQGSVHPGNDLLVESGSSSVTLENVENEPGATVTATDQLVLGSSISISLIMGPDEVFSAGIEVTVTCDGDTGSTSTTSTTSSTTTTTTTTAPSQTQPTVTVTQVCRMDIEDGPVGDITFDVDDPDGFVESITISSENRSFSVTVDAGDDWKTTRLPDAYTYTANTTSAYTGPAIEGEFTVGDDCLSCPIPEAIDLSSTTRLIRGGDTGGPVPVSIAEGIYHITLASYDDHSAKPNQGDQTEEIWALTGTGFQSPSADDLDGEDGSSEPKNFGIYEVTRGENFGNDQFDPVYVPALSQVSTLHTGPLGKVNSIQPVCAQFEPVTQSITVTKIDNGTSVDPGFTFVMSGTDVGGNVVNDTVELDFGETFTWDLLPGDFSLIEQPRDGFTLVDWFCENGDDPTAITLEAGEQVNCFFENQADVQPGKIVVVKEILDGSDAGQTFTFDPEALGAEFTLGDGESAEFDVDPGSYDVEEILPEGWALDDVSCDDSDSERNSGDGATFNVGSGETVTCTFSNGELPTISVTKLTIPVEAGDDTEFAFEGAIDADLGDGETATATVAPGAHAVTETVVDGWALSDITCDAGGDGDIDTATATYTVGYGDDVNCTFTNVEEDVLDTVIVAITISGECVLDDGVAKGHIDVTLEEGVESVEIFQDGEVIATLTESGRVNVDVGETYGWTATAEPGFELDETFGSVEVEDCQPIEVLDTEILPETGMDSDRLILVSSALLAIGLLMVLATRRRGIEA